MTKRVEIAGAGFAGLSAAIALRQLGWQVRVFEAHDTLREIGAGIFLWDNALEALKQLGVLEPIRQACAQPLNTVVIRDARETARTVTNRTDGHYMWTIRRQALHRILVDRALALGVVCEPGAPVAGAHPDGRLTLADGRHCQADLVIGADGIGSTVRGSLGIQARRSDFNYGIIRLLIAQETEPGADVIDHWSLSPLPRRMLLVPCDRHHLYVAMVCAADDADAAGLPVRVPAWSAAFPAQAELLARAFAEGHVAHYNVYSTIHVDRWTSGRCALIGDAAHGMPPTMGQGAGTAIWNAVALARFLAEDDDVPAALSRWETACKPMTLETQRKSEELAMLGPGRSERSKAELLTHGSHVYEEAVQARISQDLACMLNFSVQPGDLAPYERLDWYRNAQSLVQAFHADKLDRLQRPAAAHFSRVMLRLLRLQPDASIAQMQAALLHDALEPGRCTQAQLLERGILPAAVRIIDRISLPRDNRDYLHYIDDLATSSDAEAKEVKLADNYDAYDLFLMLGTPEGIERVRTQYHPSVRKLRAGLVNAKLLE